jgi:hypothetical protein
VSEIGWLSFSPLAKPRPLLEVLTEAWEKSDALRGRPDILCISESLAEASPTLSNNLAKLSVSLETLRNDHSLASTLGVAQKRTDEVMYSIDSSSCAGQDDIGDPIEFLNRTFLNWHNGKLQRSLISAYLNVENIIHRWLALPRLDITPLEIPQMDWTPGKWLSSWEASVPKIQSGHFKKYENRPFTRFCSDIKEDPRIKSDADECRHIKDIIACWPNSADEIAESIGVTPTAFKRVTKRNQLFDDELTMKLEVTLGMKYNIYEPYYTAQGPHVLVARKAPAVERVHSELTSYQEFSSYEVLPAKGQADPSWRYIVLKPSQDLPSFLMVPRGSKIMDSLSKSIFRYS